ncbi:bacterio-opsin activator [Salinadaptatus halalkaliphilus]|uniref:Bacterio-opsin activator n=1 Tax=Salinadaptatus halalkaliphilus TaxID=2419781 RepID=A0A4S3TTK1_9EURY|nr:helix-turn-helix domain-containing protein [Salinadaptatus halalkaliphilus]THE66743.1 bacterio-opsin activator [Salinadaptatus halalkaliphilus]
MATLVEFSVPAEEFPLGELFASIPGSSVELERIVPTDDSLFPYVWIRGASQHAVETALERSSATAGFELVDDLGDRGLLYRTNWIAEEDGVVSAIADADVTLLSATGKRDQWSFRLRIDEYDQLRAFQDRCHDLGVHIALSRLQPLEQVDDERDMTSAQLEALELAFREGYFDDPRRATLSELAAELEITRQSLAGRLRRGHRNLLADLFRYPAGSAERATASVQD